MLYAGIGFGLPDFQFMYVFVFVLSKQVVLTMSNVACFRLSNCSDDMLLNLLDQFVAHASLVCLYVCFFVCLLAAIRFSLLCGFEACDKTMLHQTFFYMGFKNVQD